MANDIESQIDAATPSLLCGEKELELIKDVVNEATKAAKRENDYADWQKVRAPRTQQEWKEYGEKNPGW